MIWSLLACGEPGPPGHLVYVAERDGRATVRVIGADGADDRPLSATPGASFPAFVAGDDVIVVTAEDVGPHLERLWRVPLDGGPAVELGARAGRVRSPGLAPDGSVVFEADLASYGDVWRLSGDGAPVRLTDAPGGSFEPDVAPDGRIAFGTSRDGNAEVYVRTPDGAAARLTDHPADDVRPRWSPDGARIGWLSHRQGAPRVWIADADGHHARALRTLGQEPAMDLDFAWSPDGGTIAVVAQRGPHDVGISLVPLDGPTVELDGPGVDEGPAWSPDGRWLAFSSSRDGDPELYVVRRDGTGLRRLTTRPGADWLPRWTP